jgi:uncharacterized protein (DUF486 family)
MQWRLHALEYFPHIYPLRVEATLHFHHLLLRACTHPLAECTPILIQHVLFYKCRTMKEIPPVRTIVLLTISNIFMTFAWYGHLKYRSSALWKVILVSWGIAFFEYCFQVPANRVGSYEFSTAQLKTIQEVITLSVFSVFSVLYLGEKIKWNYAAGFGCIALAVFFVFHKW